MVDNLWSMIMDESDVAASGDGSAEASLAYSINNGQRAKLQVHKGKQC